MTNAQDLHLVNEPEMGYGQLFGILLRRIVWFGGAIAVAMAAAIVLTSREEPTYQSSMQLLVEPNYDAGVDITQSQVEGPSLSQTDYATQLNLMRSSLFTEQAITKLVEEYPDLCDAAADIAQCAAPFQQALALSQLSEGSTATRIFVATVTGQDPNLTQAFLNALGEVYLTYNQEQQQQRLEDGLRLVDQQIEEVQGNWTAAREELREFREFESLINPEQQGLALAATVEQLEQNNIQLVNDFQAMLGRYQEIQQQLASDPESALVSSRLSQSGRYQQLLGTLLETQVALAQQAAVYTPNHPNVRTLQRQRDQEIALLQQEVVNVLGTVPPQLGTNETDLLRAGQLAGIDIGLVNDMVQAQVELRGLAAQQAALRGAREQLRAELNEFPSLIAEFDRIQPEIGIQQQSLEQLLQLRQELSNELAQGGFNWDVVAEPQLGRKIAPVPSRNLLLGAVAGIFVGGALAFGREAMDKVVHTSEDLRKQAPLPLLGVVPEFPSRKLAVLPMRGETAQSSAEAFVLSQWQPFRDGVDLIYKTIQLTNPQPLSSLMVTSAAMGEGKTTLAIALAVSAARAHQRVLLIDANWRHPSVHEQLGVSNERGLSSRLSSRELRSQPLATVTVNFGNTPLDVLTAGPVPDDPVRFLSSRQMRRLMTLAESNYDLVVVDAPAMVGLADGLQLASLCKGVMMVSRLEQITQADLTAAMTLLRQVNAVGMVANGYRGGGKVRSLYSYSDAAESPVVSLPQSS